MDVLDILIDDIPDDDTMTAQEAADALKIDLKWLYQVLRRHELPHFKIGDRHGRIRLWKKPFYLWLAARTVYGLQGLRRSDTDDQV